MRESGLGSDRRREEAVYRETRSSSRNRKSSSLKRWTLAFVQALLGAGAVLQFLDQFRSGTDIVSWMVSTLVFFIVIYFLRPRSELRGSAQMRETVELLENELDVTNAQTENVQGPFIPGRPLDPTTRARKLASRIAGRAGPFTLGLKAVAEGRFDDALRRLCKAIKHNTMDPARIHAALGDMEFYSGNYIEAAEYYRASLESLSNNLKVINNRGIALTYANRPERAEPLLKRALEIRESTLGPDHPHVAMNLANLAALYNAPGRYEDAELLLKRAIDIWERMSRPCDTYGIAFLWNLGALYASWGRYEEAEPLYRRALAETKKALGLDHINAGLLLSYLGGVYHCQSRYEEAEHVYKQALAIMESALGHEKRDLAVCLESLGALYWEQKRYVDAETCYKQALEVRKNEFGPDHSEVADVLNTLGVFYQEQGRFKDAELVLLSAMEIRERAHGPEYLALGEVLNNLGIALHGQRRYGEAEPFLKRALEIRERGLGPEHPDFISTMEGYASLLRDMNRTKEAEKLKTRVVSVLRDLETLDSSHDDPLWH